jgi:hypothetical protein
MGWTRAALAIVLVAAIAAGCGGDDDGSDSAGSSETPTTTPTPTPTPTATPEPEITHDEFVAQVDAVCREGNRATRRYNREFQQAAEAGDYGQAADIREAALNENRDRIDDFPTEAPSDEEATYERYLAQVRRIQALEPRIIAALRAGDIQEVQRLSALGQKFRNRRTEAAIDLGLEVCGA